ncbi:MAG: hypothetical protein JNK11_02195 [Alphaproteobacteria bacterium]|nr:hypothetical protein [Alphaproteobacteria bacterium]
MKNKNEEKHWEMPAPLPAVETDGRGLTPADLQEFAQKVLDDPIIMKKFRYTLRRKYSSDDEMASSQWPMNCYARQYLNFRKVNWRWTMYLMIAYQLVLAIERREMDSVYSEDAILMIERYSKTFKKPQD